MIEVSNLSKKYGNHPAVSDLSFKIEKGLITGFLGPNGAGKSTTMNMMTGFLAPSEGTVLIDGIDILKEPEKAKKLIGYLPEQPPVYMDMTVREYLMFASELKKVPAKERKAQIEKIEEMMSLTEVDTRLIKNLSKGYRQRVGFAQALIGFPPIIILDEPMVGLDPKQIIEIRDLIMKLKEDHTVILSSHILSEISMVADRIMIISGGKLVAYDTPENLIKSGNKKDEVTLMAKCGIDKAKEILALIENITFEVKESSEELCEAVINSENEEELAEKVFFAFADARVPLVELHQKKGSLEDIFLELTDSEYEAEASEEEDENSDKSTEEASEEEVNE